MSDSERRYVDLIFRSSQKYASWDPEIPIRCGDYGRITAGYSGWRFWRKRRGIFLKEGSIYEDGQAEKWKIPPPKEHGADATEGITWITSKNAQAIDVSAHAGGQMPVLANCKAQAAFKFSSGRGAILVMENDTISTIDPPARLKRLLDDESMRNFVIVSEVHRCSSYARFLSGHDSSDIAIGLSVDTPAGAAAAKAEAKWVRSTSSGNFKARVSKNGTRDFYPLFRLVAIQDNGVSTGMRGDENEVDLPLPDAEPPWIADLDQAEKSVWYKIAFGNVKSKAENIASK